MKEKTAHTTPTENTPQLEGGTYEIIRSRLSNQAKGLRERMEELNQARKEVFGTVETQLLANDRITTSNNCIPQDMVAIGHHFLFAYNVHIGLRTEIKMEDVFSAYRFEGKDHSFHEEALDLLADAQFHEDFHNLYKYYKDTVFAKFALIGPHLFMVFQVGKNTSDIKTFKWAIGEDKLTYLGNRFDHEFRYPAQHEFSWKRTSREMHRRGTHPHVSIEDRLFVETVGGDLTIKVEDNTDSGLGIYQEPVEHQEQTLDDADIYYADLGNLVLLKVRPYQEKEWRYLIFNEKMQEVLRVDALEEACVRLPDEQGIIFSNGYYLQTGNYKIFDKVLADLHFEKRIVSPNGEDFLYVFFQPLSGEYVLLPYNLVAQEVDTPIICHGFTIFPNGELCYFRAESEPGRHHVVQVWQTPYGQTSQVPNGKADTYLYKVGNKDLVRGMAECNEVLTLLNREDSYGNLYIDLVKKTGDVVDSYYWINHADAFTLSEPLNAIRETAASAIDEFEKVRRIKKNTAESFSTTARNLEDLLDKIKRKKPQKIEQFVGYLSDLRALKGEIIALKDLRYADLAKVEEFEEAVNGHSQEMSEACVNFLLKEDALQPYVAQVEELDQAVGSITKVAEADEVGSRIDETGRQLELLIEVVGNLKIEDATQTTAIIDRISTIYASLNTLRAQLKKARKDLQGTEATAEFAAQLKLLNQGLINYIDLCDSPEKCEEYLTKLMVQLEELEGKFVDFDQFITELGEKREEIYAAFETRRLALLEARNKRSQALFSSAERILKGISNRLKQVKEIKEIHAYFAADLMVSKVRDIIADLTDMQDAVKAGDLQARLKTTQEEAIRQLKDREELFVDGENVIQFGRHAFAVNTQNLDLTVVPREGEMMFHLTGTNFFEPIADQAFLSTAPVWQQSIISENERVYRAEFLAMKLLQLLKGEDRADLLQKEQPALQAFVQKYMAPRFHEGYVKGVHDHDAALILRALLEMEEKMGLLTYAPGVRAFSRLFWEVYLDADEKVLLEHQLKGAALVLKVFPQTHEFDSLIEEIQEKMAVFLTEDPIFDPAIAAQAASYLFQELTLNGDFSIASEAEEGLKAFRAFLKKRKATTNFKQSIAQLPLESVARWDLVQHWVKAFLQDEAGQAIDALYAEEMAALLLTGTEKSGKVIIAKTRLVLSGLAGDHAVLEGGSYALNYHLLKEKLALFHAETLPLFERFTQLKKELTAQFREELKLESFQPRVLTSFVRNQLIDKVYLPLIGDNLAKQMGTVGENTRTDRMGMLLLISPPGYGKTTLMEYIANRLGLIFMKINGPAIGHQVTSLDPAEAPNAAAREELEKLNLALEMGDNVMLYVDDIQHCHPEFLQKFISLCDAQRKIEGVYKGKTRTYDLRGKKVVVVMAGNPYTESGEKFQIPDMLANRADTYNLGDIIGDSDDAFKLSYIENALTSNPILARMAGLPQKDIHQLARLAESGEETSLDLSSHVSPEDLNDYLSVLRKLFRLRDVILKVNLGYIRSAAQSDEYRTEPRFQLQGSYRNMNKLAEKVMPIMNEEELNTLILSHYEGEAQTLTSGAEANLLKFKQMNGYAKETDEARWKEICQIFMQQKMMSADRMAQLVREMGAFSEGLMGIKEVLEKGMENGKKKSK